MSSIPPPGGDPNKELEKQVALATLGAIQEQLDKHKEELMSQMSDGDRALVEQLFQERRTRPETASSSSLDDHNVEHLSPEVNAFVEQTFDYLIGPELAALKNSSNQEPVPAGAYSDPDSIDFANLGTYTVDPMFDRNTSAARYTPDASIMAPAKECLQVAVLILCSVANQLGIKPH